ncbi:hypothetical protein WG66_003784 [Moniliophthora roreri]|nr:hypothetical protein WG66_003784 [Moniliophthora roreri]
MVPTRRRTRLKAAEDIQSMAVPAPERPFLLPLVIMSIAIIQHITNNTIEIVFCCRACGFRYKTLASLATKGWSPIVCAPTMFNGATVLPVPPTVNAVTRGSSRSFPAFGSIGGPKHSDSFGNVRKTAHSSQGSLVVEPLVQFQQPS